MVQLRTRLARFITERRGGMPQREFARTTGLAQSTIMRIENLDQNVTLDTLEQLCKTFRVDIAELFPHIPQSPRINYKEQQPHAAVLHEDQPKNKSGKK
jgi:transcriptional regulator with XRE-family HTH domain